MTYKNAARVILEFAPLLFVILVPFSVHAGVFASFVGMFERSPEMSKAVHTDSGSVYDIPLLRAALHADPNPAKGGGDILMQDGALVSEGGVSDSEDAVSTRTANGEISIHTVREYKEGDIPETLSDIAELYDVSVNTILWANDIKDPDLIRPGDELVILPITGVQHVVKEGDTLASIAKKYGEEDDDIEAVVEDVIAYNQLAGADDISVGDTVVIPGGVIEAPAPSRSATPSRTSGGTTAVASGGGSAGYTNPLPGSVKTQGLHGYNGVDLGGLPVGTAVLAAAAGDVIVAKSSGWNGGYGSYVVVKHSNGTQTLYAHLDSVSVGVGERVGAGQRIGGVGSTGRSTGIHLHFEVRGASNPF